MPVSQQFSLKEGDIFMVGAHDGDLDGEEGSGLYYHDTRYLSLLVLQVNGQPPLFLSAGEREEAVGALQLANPTLDLEGDRHVMPQTIGIRRSYVVDGTLTQRLELTNYNSFPVDFEITLRCAADFRDIFDIRGFPRDRWGKIETPRMQDGALVLGYQALDGSTPATFLTFEPSPTRVDIHETSRNIRNLEPDEQQPGAVVSIDAPSATVSWQVQLQPGLKQVIDAQIAPGEAGSVPSGFRPFADSVRRVRDSYARVRAESTDFSTGNDSFNRLLSRSLNDLRALSEREGDGYFPAAGIPWYVCPFGRDPLITALQTISLNPRIALGTLRRLARHQGTKEDTWREEQPGKILHEVRFGEMARTGMVPHSPYFGTVDATPLFVMLFVEAVRWTGDHALYDELLPNVLRAVDWIDRYGDVDGDGFVEYTSGTSPTSIRNQVWKDSLDSTQMPDGSLAESPIAAVEVQGYVYAAKVELGKLLQHFGDTASADRLAREAEQLRARFNETFWMPEEAFFAQALDRDKRKVSTLTTNPGHALWCGIADDDKAAAMVERMMRPDLLSGWGLRTISASATSYNPMSYHNGSIWPHDNSIVAAGMKRYGLPTEANSVINEISNAAPYFSESRLPELYCGFPRDPEIDSGPVQYPVSCSPQAWAAGAPFLMLQSILGLSTDALTGVVRLKPTVPEWLGWVRVSNLLAGGERLELIVRYGEDGDQVEQISGSGGIKIEVEQAV